MHGKKTIFSQPYIGGCTVESMKKTEMFIAKEVCPLGRFVDLT